MMISALEDGPVEPPGGEELVSVDRVSGVVKWDMRGESLYGERDL